MWYVILINVIETGGCVALNLGIGVCMLVYVVNF